MTSRNVLLLTSLDHVAFNETRNAVFILLNEMCIVFVAEINVILMRPLYEANILCDCITNDQEPIKSISTSRPGHRMGKKKNIHQVWNQVYNTSGQPSGHFFPSRCS